ncbi:MAG: LPS export ABC transporter periplasmic protein LptC [Pedobacter sp.]|nr:LPS export ABC transporter periplasmic protein LptC [Pedobacter sp.]
MDTRNLASLAGVLLVLGAAGWYWGMGASRTPAKADDEKGRPDYVIRDIQGLETNEKGQVERRLSAPEVRHYDKPVETAEIDTPVFTFYDEGKESWRLTAQHGQVLNGNREVLLTEQVHAERRDPAAIAVTLDTDTMHVFPKEERLYTKSQVKIASPQGQLASRGLEANIRNGNLLLNENVTGNYAPARR